MQQIVLPTREDVLLLHDLVLAATKGRPGILHDHHIDGALQRPFTYMQYEKIDLHTVAALLIDSFSRNHAFNDGNKRTALITAIYTYAINGLFLEYSKEMNLAFEDLALRVVKQKPEIAEIWGKLSELCDRYQRGTLGSFIESLRNFIIG
jgi:death-on-curing protein